MNILVTGSEGLIGWHMRCFLHCREGVEVLPCNHQEFEDDERLSSLLQKADVVVHLAGANRGEPEEVARTNREIATRLVSQLRTSNSVPHLLFSNSIHADLETPYGRSKRDSADTYRQWASDVGACFTDILLPHVFGEHSKPFYNTVVATFAHQLVTGNAPTIENDSELNLLHALDVAQIFWDQIESQIGRATSPQRSENAGVRVARPAEIDARTIHRWSDSQT